MSRVLRRPPHRALCVLFMASLAMGIAGCTTTPAATTATATITIPPGWMSYRDPDGAFTLSQPPDWVLTRNTSTATYGGNGVVAHVPVTESHFAAPASLGVVYVSIEVAPVTTDYRTIICDSGAWQPDTTFAGDPAVQQRGASRGWFIDLSNTTYSISYGLPTDRPPTAYPTVTPTRVRQQARCSSKSMYCWHRYG